MKRGKPQSGRAIRAQLHADMARDPMKVFETLSGYFLEALFDESHPASYVQLLDFYDQEWRKWCEFWRSMQSRATYRPEFDYFLNQFRPLEFP